MRSTFAANTVTHLKSGAGPIYCNACDALTRQSHLFHRPLWHHDCFVVLGMALKKLRQLRPAFRTGTRQSVGKASVDAARHHAFNLGKRLRIHCPRCLGSRKQPFAGATFGKDDLMALKKQVEISDAIVPFLHGHPREGSAFSPR